MLYDFADLDSWHNGEQATYSYNSMQIPREHPAFQGSEKNHTTWLSCVNKGKALWWILARLAGWNPVECDYNGDSIVNEFDLIDRKEDVSQEFTRWLKECWQPLEGCADFDKNGIFNTYDVYKKFVSIWMEYYAWMRKCGFQNKTFLIF